MKKTFLAILCLALGASTFAQVKLRPGFRAGLNASTFTNTENTSRKIGVNGAIFANVHFARFYELQPELTFSSQGYKRDDFTIAGSTIEGDDYSVNYLGVAITNKFFIVPKTGLHLIVGPTVEINIGDDFNDDAITPIDFSLFGGIGYEFPIGLGIEARYKHGIIDVRDSFYDDIADDEDAEFGDFFDDNLLNSVFQFNIYYKFNF